MRILTTLLALLIGLAATADAPPEEPECHLHQSPLRDVEVPVTYGLPPFRSDLDEAVRTLFPYGTLTVNGGCLIGEPRTRVVTRCAVCAVAREAYEAGFAVGFDRADTFLEAPSAEDDEQR